jgi:hypothetical protein
MKKKFLFLSMIMAAACLFAQQNNSEKPYIDFLNYRHAFVKDLFGKENAGRFIADAYNGRVANVYIN